MEIDILEISLDISAIWHCEKVTLATTAGEAALTHTHTHTYTPAYLPHSSSIPFLSAVAAIRVTGAHAILIAHGHSPIAALSSVHIHFPVISYTYTALVVSFRPCDVCLCGRSQSSGGKHRAGQTEQTSGGRL